MEITVSTQDGVFNVYLKGRFTFGDHQEFRAILRSIEQEATTYIIFHMAEVDFVDSAALGMLLLALDEVEKHHKKLTLSGATGQVKKMFDLARFNTLFTIV